MRFTNKHQGICSGSLNRYLKSFIKTVFISHIGQFRFCFFFFIFLSISIQSLASGGDVLGLGLVMCVFLCATRQLFDALAFSLASSSGELCNSMLASLKLMIPFCRRCCDSAPIKGKALIATHAAITINAIYCQVIQFLDRLH